MTGVRCPCLSSIVHRTPTSYCRAPQPAARAETAEGANGFASQFLSGSVRWLIAAIVFLCLALPVLWATLAIYYSNLPWFALRLGLAAAFAAFAIWALWFSGQRRMSVIAAVLFLGVVVWWIAIPPSHDRNWRPEVAVMPRA